MGQRSELAACELCGRAGEVYLRCTNWRWCHGARCPVCLVAFLKQHVDQPERYEEFSSLKFTCESCSNFGDKCFAVAEPTDAAAAAAAARIAGGEAPSPAGRGKPRGGAAAAAAAAAGGAARKRPTSADAQLAAGKKAKPAAAAAADEGAQAPPAAAKAAAPAAAGAAKKRPAATLQLDTAVPLRSAPQQQQQQQEQQVKPAGGVAGSAAAAAASKLAGDGARRLQRPGGSQGQAPSHHSSDEPLARLVAAPAPRARPSSAVQDARRDTSSQHDNAAGRAARQPKSSPSPKPAALSPSRAAAIPVKQQLQAATAEQAPAPPTKQQPLQTQGSGPARDMLQQLVQKKAKELKRESSTAAEEGGAKKRPRTAAGGAGKPAAAAAAAAAGKAAVAGGRPASAGKGVSGKGAAAGSTKAPASKPAGRPSAGAVAAAAKLQAGVRPAAGKGGAAGSTAAQRAADALASPASSAGGPAPAAPAPAAAAAATFTLGAVKIQTGVAELDSEEPQQGDAEPAGPPAAAPAPVLAPKAWASGRAASRGDKACIWSGRLVVIAGESMFEVEPAKVVKVHAAARLPPLLADADCVEGTLVGRDLMDKGMAACLGGPCTPHFEHSQLQVREKALGGQKVLPRLVETLVRTKQYVRLREKSEVLHLGPVLKSPEGKVVDFKTDTGIQAHDDLSDRVHLDRVAVVLYLAPEQQPPTPTAGPGGMTWDRTKVAFKPSLKLGAVGGKPAVSFSGMEAPGGAVGAAAVGAEAALAHAAALRPGAGDIGDDDAAWLHDTQPAAAAVGTPMRLGAGFGAPLADGQPLFMADDGFAEHSMPAPAAAVAPAAAALAAGSGHLRLGMMEADDDFGGFDMEDDMAAGPISWQEQPPPMPPPEQQQLQQQRQHHHHQQQQQQAAVVTNGSLPHQAQRLVQQQPDGPPQPPPPQLQPQRGEQTPSSAGHSPQQADAPAAQQLQPQQQLGLASQPLAAVLSNPSKYPAAKLIPTLDKLVAYIDANGLRGLKIHFDSSFMQHAPAAKELADYARREEATVTLGGNGSYVPPPAKVNILLVSRGLFMSAGLHQRHGDHFLSRYLLEGVHVLSEEFFTAVQHGGGALSHVRGGGEPANVPWEFFAGGCVLLLDEVVMRCTPVQELQDLIGMLRSARRHCSQTIMRGSTWKAYMRRQCRQALPPELQQLCQGWATDATVEDLPAGYESNSQAPDGAPASVRDAIKVVFNFNKMQHTTTKPLRYMLVVVPDVDCNDALTPADREHVASVVHAAGSRETICCASVKDATAFLKMLRT